MTGKPLKISRSMRPVSPGVTASRPLKLYRIVIGLDPGSLK